jgi:hypothetical protein
MLDAIVPDRLRVGFNRNFGQERGIILCANNTGVFERSAILIESFEAGAIAPSFQLSKFTGTANAPGNVALNDRVGILEWDSYSNVSTFCAGIEVDIDAAVVAGQRTATRMVFKTALNNAPPLDNMVLFSNGFLVVGSDKTARGVAEANALLTVGGNGTVQEYLERASGDVIGPELVLKKTRGTLAAPADVVSADQLGYLTWAARSTNEFQIAQIYGAVDAAVVAGQSPASRLVFRTALNNAGKVDNMALFSNGALVLGSSKVARGVTEAPGLLNIGGNGTTEAYIERASADSIGPQIYLKKTRGTLAAPADVVNGDDLGYLTWAARSTAQFTPAEILCQIDTAVVAGQMPAGRILFRTAPANGVKTLWLQIASSGTLLVGVPGSSYDTAQRMCVGGSRAGSICRMDNDQGGASASLQYLRGGDNAITGSKFLEFARPDFTTIGSVSQNAAGTVIYNSTSDERLKTDIVDTATGLDALMKIRVREFRYKTDSTKRITHGFIAQELNLIYPDAVSVGSDSKECDCAMTPENPGHDPDCCHRNPWGVDYGRLTPLLVKAVQELYSLISPSAK